MYASLHAVLWIGVLLWGQADSVVEVICCHECLHINGLELYAIGLVSKPKKMSFKIIMLPSDHVRQSLCHYLPAKKQGNMASIGEHNGYQSLQIGQAKIHDTDTQAPPWAIEHVIGRSPEPQRSDSEIRIVSVPSRSPIVEGWYMYVYTKIIKTWVGCLCIVYIHFHDENRDSRNT